MSASPALATAPMCAVHPDVPSVRTCSRCGRFSCTDCLNEKDVCRDCEKRATASLPPLEGRAQAASISLYVVSGAHALMAVIGLAQMITGQVDEDAPLALASAFAGLFYLITFIVTVVLFCRWFHRAAMHGLAHAAGMEVTTPGAAVGSWFIPFLNLVRPFRLARAMLGSAGQDPTTVNTWQGLWIAGNVIANASGRANGGSGVSLGIVSDVLLLAAGVTAAGVVRRLKWTTY